MLRIGHITDLHARQQIPGSASIESRRSRDVLNIFQQTLHTLRDQGVDVLAITGDLLDVPTCLLSPNDYYDFQLDRLREQAIADYRLMKEMLEETQSPYVVLPGNHDKESLLWEVFDETLNEIRVKGYRFVRFCDREEKCQAHRYDRERVRMTTVLSDDDDSPQIHLQHYVIHPELNKDYPHTYYDGIDLKNRIRSSTRVKLSLSGHYHPGTDLLRVEGCTFTTGPAFCEYPHPYRIYTVEEESVFMTEHNGLETPTHFNRPVAFLDRDGVINTLPAYRTGPDLLELTPHAGKAIANFHEAGYCVVIISSQSCVGGGYVSIDTLHANHEHLCSLLREEAGDSAQPDLFLYSVGAGDAAVHPSLKDRSNAKPMTTLPDQARAILQTRLSGSFFVGDNKEDIETGRNLGIDSYLVQTGNGKKTLDTLQASKAPLKYVVVENLYELSTTITQHAP